MGILTKEVEIKPSGKSIQYYKNLGYNAKWHEPILVKVEDLAPYSSAKVDVLCDFCKKEICSTVYSYYSKSMKKYGSYACQKCNLAHSKQTVLKKYGTEYVLQATEIREKAKETLMKRYGVDNAMKNKDIQNAAQKTRLDKYGVPNCLLSEEIKEKIRKTCNLKYGTDHPMQSPEIYKRASDTRIAKYGTNILFHNSEIREKAKETLMKRYGVDNISQIPEVKTKKAQTFYNNESQKSSKQQRYLCRLYEGVLNFNIRHYSADICLPSENLVVEYNGGGHTLNVKIGKETMEEYNKREIIRNNVIKQEGYKQMIIVSNYDKLPSDTVLLQMLEHTKQYFSDYPNHSWIEFNIDTSTVHNAEQKDGVFFDYGTLRRIKELA